VEYRLFDLTGRRALITGSSQGIGFALAQGLAAAGAQVVLNGRDASRLAAAAERIAGAEMLAFDATDHDGVRAAVDGFEASGKPIDILVNNAGMQHRAPLEEFPPMPSSGFFRRTSRACSMWVRRSRAT
jgi:gluconate 5-dehydrogenase